MMNPALRQTVPPTSVSAQPRHVEHAPVPELLLESPLDGTRSEWQMRFRGLQQWVCDLLIRNQQLRMELLATKAQEPGGRDARDA